MSPKKLSAKLSAAPVPNTCPGHVADSADSSPKTPANKGMQAVPENGTEPLFVYLSPVPPLYKRDRSDTAAENSLPAWLRKAIETENPTAFGKLARFKKCGRCGQWTIIGWDANDDYAGHAVTDPVMLTTAQEAAALLVRRWTYNLIIDNGTQAITLARRDQWQIPAHPATGWRYPVTPAHRCGAPLGQPIPSEQFTQGNN